MIRLIGFVLIWVIAVGCQAPPPDPSGELLRALESQEWERLEGRLMSAEQMSAFPLRLALNQGARWRGLALLRRLDSHLLFEVDLEVDERLSRYAFWVEAPRPPVRSASATRAQNQSFSGEVAQGELSALGRLIDWSEPYAVERHTTLTEPSVTPARFAIPTYREPQGHYDYARTSRVQLGVIDLERGDVLEEGWTGYFSIQDLSVSAPESVRSRRAIRRCSRLSAAVISKQMRLDSQLNQSCQGRLLLTAQRARYLGESNAQPHVDVAHGNQGGRRIRDTQDELVDGEPRFNGRITLGVKLKRTASPEVRESMIIAPSLTKCIKETFSAWADRLKRSECELIATFNFSVQRETNEEGETLGSP